jgi:serine/threonine protein phosphatase PrpC
MCVIFGRPSIVELTKPAQIVILSSDGLVDNLFDEDILEEVLRYARFAPAEPAGLSAGLTLMRFAPQIVSEALCKRAKAVSEDQHAVTSPCVLPFLTAL